MAMWERGREGVGTEESFFCAFGRIHSCVVRLGSKCKFSEHECRELELQLGPLRCAIDKYMVRALLHVKVYIAGRLGSININAMSGSQVYLRQYY